ncbi:MAG: 4'-phosphopantetheinyl transferase family protein [Christensenellaceae bacterium]|jgi:phosphopantetheinyl transferase
MNNVYLYLYEGVPLSSVGLLYYTARLYCKEIGLSMKELPALSYTERGKPYFREFPEIQFSLSHSGGYWAVAFSPVPIGLDLEKAREANMASIASRFFHPEEYAYLKQQDYTDFFHIWTAKESYVKLTGEGITDAFMMFSVVAEGELKPPKEAHAFWFDTFLDYTLCVCAGVPFVITKQKLEQEEVKTLLE